jgi:SAM-dependent methyltransferase
MAACQNRATPTALHPLHADSSLVDDGPILPTNDSLSQNYLGFDDADRENWQKPQIVISSLGDLSDKVVADIGAGTGYFTMPLARQAHRVIAVEIEQQYLDYINRRLSRARDKRTLDVETRLTSTDDPALQPGEADVVLLVNTYSFIEHRVAYFQKVHRGMAPGGRIVIVDFKREPLPVGPSLENKIAPESVIVELDSAGFDHQMTDLTSLDYQYILTLKRR